MDNFLTSFNKMTYLQTRVQSLKNSKLHSEWERIICAIQYQLI